MGEHPEKEGQEFEWKDAKKAVALEYAETRDFSMLAANARMPRRSFPTSQRQSAGKKF